MTGCLPAVPVRQWGLSLPFDLRRLAAFKADVLSALVRIFIEAVFTRYRACGIVSGEAHCGAVTFVQRFGSSLNLNVHFHVVVLDGLYTRDPQGRLGFHPAPAPDRRELEAMVARAHGRAIAWLSRHGHLQAALSTEPTSAIEACAELAMRRGSMGALRAAPDGDRQDEQAESPQRVLIAAIVFRRCVGGRPSRAGLPAACGGDSEKP